MEKKLKIAGSVSDYFRYLRSRKWKEELKKDLTNENVTIINCLYVDDDGIDFKKGDKK